MTVVITVLAVLAAAIMPNLLSERQSREARQFFSKARNLMLEARTRAIADTQTRTIRLDETAGTLIVERTDAETGEASQDRSLALPTGVTGNSYRIGNIDSNGSEWQMRFYADGKSDGGGISFDSNGRIKSLVIDRRGAVRQVDGELPAVEEESWDAGGYEQRI
jgi:type II secretory pathway pseudopilin PulG